MRQRLPSPNLLKRRSPSNLYPPFRRGRPRADEDKSSERDALQVEAHAECLAAVVTRNGTPPVMKFARVGFVFVPCFAVV